MKETFYSKISGLKSLTRSFISGIILGTLISIIFNKSLILNRIHRTVTKGIESALALWTNTVSVETGEGLALNAVLLVTFAAMLLNWYNKDSPSQFFTAVFDLPSISVWLIFIDRLLSVPYLGKFLQVLGSAVRLYGSAIILLAYASYPVIYILTTDLSLFLATPSLLLASASFGAIFGRLEKGLVLAFKDSLKSNQDYDLLTNNKYEIFYWYTAIPVSIILSFLVSNYAVRSLNQPSTEAEFSVFISVSVGTIMFMVFIYHVVILTVLISAGVYLGIRSYHHDAGLRAFDREMLSEEISNAMKSITEKDPGNDALPKEVADTLRLDNRAEEPFRTDD